MRSFRIRTIVIACALVAVSSLPLIYLFAYREEAEAWTREFELARTIAVAAALGSADALLTGNTEQLQHIEERLHQEWSDVQSVGFYGVDGSCLWHTDKKMIGRKWQATGLQGARPPIGLLPFLRFEGLYTVSAQSQKEDARCGTVTVGYSFGRLQQSLQEAFMNVARMLVCMLILGVFLSYILSERVSHPVRELMRQVEKVSAGDLSGAVKVVSRDEIGTLAEKFNKMMSDLKAARDQIQNHQRSLEARIRQIRAELEQTQKDLLKSEKFAAIGQLAAGVAHELNNPLAGILLSSQLLATEVEDENIKKSLAEIEEQSCRCKRIIEDLLSFARRGYTEGALTDANEIVENAIASLAKRDMLQKIDLRKSLCAEALRIKGDPTFLQRAFSNLIENAIEAVNREGRVEIGSGKADGKVEVRIRDWGCGIGDENLSRIFDPFFTTKATGSGVGLGLSISYGIVERHGGTIRVESHEGQGSTFVVMLPAFQEIAEAEVECQQESL